MGILHSLLCIIALAELLFAFILDQDILFKQINYIRRRVWICSHCLLLKHTVKSDWDAWVELPCNIRKKKNISLYRYSDNPCVFFTIHDQASGWVKTRKYWVCVLVSHSSQKWHFQLNAFPRQQTRIIWSQGKWHWQCPRRPGQAGTHM